MKKLFTLVVASTLTLMATAQPCTPDPTITESGLYPASRDLCCLVNGTAESRVIQFKNFTTVASFTVEYLRIDSVTNFPPGLTYQLDQADRTYDAGENGCILVSGTPTGTNGQYRLNIFVGIKATGIPEIQGEAGTLAAQFPGVPSFSYFVRMKDAGMVDCPVLDTTQTASNQLIAYTGTETTEPCGTGVRDLSSELFDLTITPSVVNNSSEVSFVSDVIGNFNTSITNMIGATVMSRSMEVGLGSNRTVIERNGLPAGVYFFNITNGNGHITKRFVIAD